MLDYFETSSNNKNGSASARDITGASANLVKAKNYALYYVAIGKDVINSEALEYYASDSTNTQHFYVAKQEFESETNDPSHIGFNMVKSTLQKIAKESSAPMRGVIIRDQMAEHFTVDVENIQNAVVTRYYYADDGETQLADVLTNPESVDGEEGLYRFNVTRGDPVSIRISFDEESMDGKSIDISVGTLWDVQTAKNWAAGRLLSDALQEEEGVFYSKAAVKFPVLVDEEAIGWNNWRPSNSEAYFSFDGGDSPKYLSPQVGFPTGGTGPSVTPPQEEEPDEEEEITTPDDTDDTGDTDDTDETPPAVPPGTPVQPGTPGVPPVPYYPGGSLIPLDDGGFLEIDENGVPLGTWKYDEEEEAWIFDEEVPLAAAADGRRLARRFRVPVGAPAALAAVVRLRLAATVRLFPSAHWSACEVSGLLAQSRQGFRSTARK
jgi:hypothetical protein